MSPLRFSIVIPSHDRPVELVACLEALSSLDFPHDRFEVIVVDDGSPTPVEAVTDAFEDRLRIRVVRRSRGGPAAARNTGVEIASGRYVVFTADDCRPRADWLTVLDARFTVDPDAGVGGRIENRETENLFSTSTDMLLRHMYAHFNTPADHSRFFTPNNLAFPLAEFRAAGGFIDSFVTGEDRELCDRWRTQGRRLLYAPEAVVEHHHPLGFGGFLYLHYRYGRGSFRFRREAARRGSAAARFEPASFYFGLIRYPLAASRGGRGLAMSGLLCLAQVANAIGFFRQALAQSRR